MTTLTEYQKKALNDLRIDLIDRINRKQDAMDKYEDSTDPRYMRLETEQTKLLTQKAALVQLMRESGVIPMAKEGLW